MTINPTLEKLPKGIWASHPGQDGAESSGLEPALGWLDLLLRRQVLRLRARHVLVESEYRGTFISDQQVDALLASQPAVDGEPEIDLLNAAISEGQAAALGSDQPTTFARLRRLFGLDEAEALLLLVGLAPALDLRYETIYAYVQNDITKKQPTLDLALRLLAGDRPARLAALHYLAPETPLLRYGLLRLTPDPQDAAPSHLAYYLQADGRVVSYLLGETGLDPRLQPFTRLAEPGRPLSSLALPDDLRLGLEHVARYLSRRPAAVFLRGSQGVGKRPTAAALAAALGRRLLEVDLSAIPIGPVSQSEVLRLLHREARLQDALLYLGRYESLEGSSAQAQAVSASLAGLDRPVFLGSRSEGYLSDAWPAAELLEIPLPMPVFTERLGLWQSALQGAPLHPQADLVSLAGKFRLSAGGIADAARYAVALTANRPTAEASITTADLYRAARARSNQALRDLAQKIEPHYHWEDLVLPRQSLQQLREVYLAVRHHPTVYGAWGFEQKHFLSEGVNALFFGPSGTGKTMAAEILANELGLDLYRIDLSTVVSKYIGDTEKNLARIFAAAESSNAILFFDEADALFGKRSEVKDSHDRYANIEVAYLLQKMERYDGIAILATNLRGNMDEAFARRLHHTVGFPLPDPALRERIWRGVFPPQTPLSAEVDFGFLSRQFELSGGNIRNVALSAAFMAAEAGGRVTMEQLVVGVARELQKMEKMPTRSAFRDFYSLVLEN